MEKPLEQLLDEIVASSGVAGVICADKQGLCLGAKGAVCTDAAGYITGIAQQAAKLTHSSKVAPVICIESDQGTLLIKSHDKVTMGVYKT